MPTLYRAARLHAARAGVFTIICFVLLAAHARAQCSNQLVAFGPPCGVGGVIYASVAWDPDGPGPQPERLAVGGAFATAGSVLANNIAVWDPGTGAWSALGSGCSGTVYALAALPNGDLVAGGWFNSAGGASANRIARWDGAAWSPMGSGSSSYGVQVLTVMPNGDVIAGGAFSDMGGVAVGGIARWNGSSWSAIGSSPFGQVLGLAVLPNGDLVASGRVPFTALPILARWNGATWTAFGVVTGASAGVGSLAVAANGDLIAGGRFASIGGVPANNIARWNGATWAPLGSDSAAVGALCVMPNGDVFVSRGTAGSGLPVAEIARWNGSAWTTLPGMRGYTQGHEPYYPMNQARVHTLTALASGALIAGGYFSVAGNASAQHVASWDGAQWSALSTGSGLDAVASLETLPNGDLIAVGSFEAAGTLVTTGVARWNGAAWSNLGSGGLGGGFAAAVARLPNGDVVIGGSFPSVGGVTAGSVARWNGTQWSAMGSLPAGSTVRAFAVAPNGTLFAGGWFGTGVVAWNGTAWTPLGSTFTDVYALAVLPNGSLVAGGFLASDIAVWNGTSWSPLGGTLGGDVAAVAVLLNGDLVAATTEWPNVARWNGAQWVPLGASGVSGHARALHVLPNGDLLAGGSFSWGAGQFSTLARWNGTAWSAVGTGADAPANAFAGAPNGDVWVGGSFHLASGAPSGGFARITTTCAATSQAGGGGCNGNVVTSTLPWTGSTWRADGSGLPSSALVCVVSGFATASLPLASVFTTAVPGCTLHVQPDIVVTTIASQGTATVQFVLPNTPSLAGTVFHHQMVPLALDGTWTVTATNSLQLTVGSF